MPFKAIFFDAAGTLMRTARPVGESYALFANRHGMNVPPEEVAARFHACFSSAPPLAFPGAQAKDLKALERAWWRDLVRRVFEPYGEFARFDDYFAELFAYFSKADSWRLYPETLETLAALRERGLALAVVSNFDSRLFNILKGLGVAASFDSIVISSHTGHAKPSREIFHKALALLQVRPDEAVHVGDSPDKDAAGARDAGLLGILLDRRGKAASNHFRTARSLTEIVALIEQGS